LYGYFIIHTFAYPKIFDVINLLNDSGILLVLDDLVTISEPDTTLVFVNSAYCSYFNKSRNELLGRRLVDLLPESKASDYLRIISRLTPQSPKTTGTYRSGIPNHERWISWKETGVFGEDGNLKAILSVGRDIDESFSNLWREKEQIFNTLMAFREAIDHNIICSVTDNQGRITYANRKFCEISKYSMAELIGQTHKIVNSGFHSKDFFSEMWATIKSGKSWTGEIRNRAKDGSYYWVQSVIIPIKENDGISGYLSLRNLITDHKQLEEEKNAYLKTVEEMLFSVSHEIRSPLVTSQGLLYLIRDDTYHNQEGFLEHFDSLVDLLNEMDRLSRKLNDKLTSVKKPHLSLFG